jgi:hypothetical protein
MDSSEKKFDPDAPVEVDVEAMLAVVPARPVGELGPAQMAGIPVSHYQIKAVGSTRRQLGLVMVSPAQMRAVRRQKKE